MMNAEDLERLVTQARSYVAVSAMTGQSDTRPARFAAAVVALSEEVAALTAWKVEAQADIDGVAGKLVAAVGQQTDMLAVLRQAHEALVKARGYVVSRHDQGNTGACTCGRPSPAWCVRTSP